MELLPDGHGQTIEAVMKLWWMNIRSTGGLRLTSIGYQVLKTLDMQSWMINIDDPRKINKRVILELDHKLQYPYYLDTKKRQLILFSSREAMMATLYGDLEAWLKNLP